VYAHASLSFTVEGDGEMGTRGMGKHSSRKSRQERRTINWLFTFRAVVKAVIYIFLQGQNRKLNVLTKSGFTITNWNPIVKIFKVILENIFIPILGNVNFIKYFVNISLANMLP
jgi:hypothetical protein